MSINIGDNNKIKNANIAEKLASVDKGIQNKTTKYGLPTY